MYTDYTDENDNESYYSDDDNNRQQNGEKFKKIIIFVLVFIILLVLILIMAKGCSKKSNANNQNTSQTETLKPTINIGRETLALDVGESFENGSEVINTKNPNPIITWRSDDSSIASVNDEGYITGESEGETKVTAFYRENGKVYTNTCVVTVTSKQIKLESIVLTQKEISLKIGNKFLIELTTTPTDAKVGKLIFTSDDPSIAKVDEKGIITAVSAGTTRVTIKTEDEAITASMVVNVNKTESPIVIEPTRIDVAGITNGLAIGKTAEIIYNVYPNNSTNKNVTFKSTNTKVATVNDKGIVTGVGAGTCTIIISTSNNITGSIDVTVASNTVNVTGITIVGSTSINIPVGGTRFLNYTISPSNATNKEVTYKSSNPSVVYVDSNGIMAAVGPGTAVVTITTKDGGKTAVANVTVTGTNVSGTSSSDSTSYYIPDSNMENYQTSSKSIDSSSYVDSIGESCSAYDMITITHNETGVAIVSTISFDNTKPFVKTTQVPQLEVIQTSCVKSLNYYVYYGSTENSIDTKYYSFGTSVKVGTKISLNKGKGYYKIILKGYNNNNDYLTKTYYAYVKYGTATESNYLTVTPTTASSEFSITRKNSSINRVYYCIVGSSSDDCDPSVNISGLNSIKTIYRGYITISSKAITKSLTKITSGEPSINKGAKICFSAYNGNILVGEKICRNVEEPISVTPTSSGKSFTITKLNSSVSRVYYCVTGKTTDSCIPSITTGYNISKTVYYGYVGMTNNAYIKTMTSISSGQPSLSKGAKICFKAYDGSKLIGSSFCRTIK